jgi:hypothetical protein
MGDESRALRWPAFGTFIFDRSRDQIKVGEVNVP